MNCQNQNILTTTGVSKFNCCDPAQIFEVVLPNINLPEDSLYNTESTWCVIPVYNNGSTIKNIAERCLKYIRNVLIVDDGSTDTNLKELLHDTGATVIQHSKNMGKGNAISSALRYLEQHNVKYMITIDGDGQHYPEDLPKFLSLLQEDEDSIVVGCRDLKGKNVPVRSRAGRALSNFWLNLETGVDIKDSQCGYRAYPVKYVSALKCLSGYYNFETEILAKAIWAGAKLKNISVRVWYPDDKKSRVTNFRPVRDNLRFIFTHIYLIAFIIYKRSLDFCRYTQGY